MKSHEQEVALAELAGCWFGRSEQSGGAQEWHDTDGEVVHTTPIYLKSRDAVMALVEQWVISEPMHPRTRSVVRMQSFMGKLYDCHEGEGGIDLTDVYGEDRRSISFALMFSTVPQIAEALLKASGTWIESNE